MPADPEPSLREYLERLLATEIARLDSRVDGLDRLTDSKFITHRTLLDSQAEKVALALASADKAVTKAELATERRFEGVNEFRQTLSDQSREFVRADFMLQAFEGRDQVIAALAARVRDLELARSSGEGQTEGGQERTTNLRASMATYVGVLGVVMAAVVVVVNILTR